MKIAVVGCGAMGSIYAALLADGGNDVFVVDRGEEHVERIAAEGLRVEGASGNRTVRIPAFIDIPNRPVDLVVVAVKASHVPGLAPRLHRLTRGDTIILTIQNGVGSADMLAGHVDPDRLMVGIAGGFGAARLGPGHVFHNGMNVIRMGAYAGLSFGEAQSVAEVWTAAGFAAEAVGNVIAMQWEKLICNVAYSAPCALTGLTVGELMDDPDMGPISRAAAIEAWQVARALGISIDVPDPVKLVRDFAAGMPAARPSMLQDHKNRRPSEIDVINGAIPAAAARAGIDAPVNATLAALVKRREREFIQRD